MTPRQQQGRNVLLAAPAVAFACLLALAGQPLSEDARVAVFCFAGGMPLSIAASVMTAAIADTTDPTLKHKIETFALVVGVLSSFVLWLGLAMFVAHINRPAAVIFIVGSALAFVALVSTTARKMVAAKRNGT